MRSRRTPVLLDVLLAVVLTGLSVVTIVDQDQSSGGRLGVVLAVLAVAPVALRQVAPVVVTVVIAAALAAYAALGFGDWPSSAVSLVVAVFTVATLRTRLVAAGAYAVAAGVVLLSYVTVDGVTWAMVAQAALILLCAWGLGDGTRRWALEAQEAAALAERAVAQERNRIARELHDVVAHHMSVVTLQTGLAEYVLDTDAATARTAIVHAGGAGREALRDMGRMLDALRTDAAESAPYDPQPGLRHLEDLVQRVCAAGLAVEVRRTGPARTLTPGLELCAYRVVQESLTNVLKHAGPASAVVVLVEHGERVLTVEVTDDGGGVGSSGPGTGHGILGMRERAELYGGVLETGALPDGGFRVRLRVPVGELAGAPVHAATAGPARQAPG
jgi:signal transduction histidine kinase